MKKSLLKLIPLLLIFIGFVIYDFVKSGNESKTTENYFEQLNLKISGKVKEITPMEFGHDYGVITMDLNESNEKINPILQYQIIKKTKEGKTKLLVGNISEIQQNDSIFVTKRNFKIKRNGKFLKKVFVLVLPSSNILNNPWEEVKKIMEN